MHGFRFISTFQAEGKGNILAECSSIINYKVKNKKMQAFIKKFVPNPNKIVPKTMDFFVQLLYNLNRLLRKCI